jgi:two-component system NarL family sensor kinase
VEVGVYRIVEEALNNAARHSSAECVALELTITPEQVRLVIEDDGRGFDPSDIPAGHYGLIGINERVKLLGGLMTLQSSPGEGARFDIAIPLDR